MSITACQRPIPEQSSSLLAHGSEYFSMSLSGQIVFTHLSIFAQESKMFWENFPCYNRNFYLDYQKHTKFWWRISGKIILCVLVVAQLSPKRCASRYKTETSKNLQQSFKHFYILTKTFRNIFIQMWMVYKTSTTNTSIFYILYFEAQKNRTTVNLASPWYSTQWIDKISLNTRQMSIRCIALDCNKRKRIVKFFNIIVLVRAYLPARVGHSIIHEVFRNPTVDGWQGNFLLLTSFHRHTYQSRIAVTKP